MASEILTAGRICGGGEPQGLLGVRLCCFAAFLVCFDCRFFAIEPLPRLHLVAFPSFVLASLSYGLTLSGKDITACKTPRGLMPLR
jgi:hypothetical protein